MDNNSCLGRGFVCKIKKKKKTLCNKAVKRGGGVVVVVVVVSCFFFFFMVTGSIFLYWYRLGHIGYNSSRTGCSGGLCKIRTGSDNTGQGLTASQET